MSNHAALSIEESSFGTTQAGEAVRLFTLQNAAGMQVKIVNYGGIITELQVPDQHGQLDNVVVGYPTLADYENDPFYIGAIVGRYANRIAKGRIEIDNQVFQLDINNGPNCLHGGAAGFHKMVWGAEATQGSGYVGVKLRCISPDGAAGFPGNLTTTAEYRLDDHNRLTLIFDGTTDALTPVSYTQHAYFNLAGKGSVLNHELWLASDAITPVDNDINPTGAFLPTVDTPFDFSSLKPIGQHIDDDHPQLALAGGYDHNFVVACDGASLIKQAELKDPSSGRWMTLSTNSPGMQVYSVNLDSAVTSQSSEVVMIPRGAVCLEPQHYPNAPNNGTFPSPWLAPGERCEVTFVYEFGTY